MIPSQLPSKPWQKVATDLFTWDKSEYLIIVDNHSRFFEVAKLPDTKSNTVTTHIESAFARHGIPCEVISDNGLQYSFMSHSRNSGNSNTLPPVHSTHKQMGSLKNHFKR